MTGLYKQTHTRTTLQCSEIIHVHTDKAPTWWQWNLCPTIWASEGTPRNWRRTVISLEMVTEVEGETENEREETEGVIRLWFPNLRYQRGTIKSGHRTHFCSRTQSRTITPNPARARWTTYYISSAAHAPISILSFCSGSERLSSAELVSVIESVIDAGEELTKYFEAAIANSFSSIQAPVDTMEQQAEHCQVERMQGGEKLERKKKNTRRKKRGKRDGWAGVTEEEKRH